MDKNAFSKKFNFFFFLYVIGFLLFFVGRLGYGYIPNARNDEAALTHNTANTYQTQSEDYQLARKNYYSGKDKIIPQPSGAKPVDQKYEKVGSLASDTAEFEKDEKAAMDLIKKNNAVIQQQESFGLKGGRSLKLGIGVNPDKFDDMMRDIQKIGKLASIQINKSDKTNEYKDLQAKRISLEKSREALLELKRKGGQINEFINLEQEILKVEQQIQEFGVKLGEFDQENEFCTIKFTLREKGSVGEIGIFTRIKVALEWTLKYYLAFSGVIFIGLLSVLVLVIIIEKLKNLISQIFAMKAGD